MLIFGMTTRSQPLLLCLAISMSWPSLTYIHVPLKTPIPMNSSVRESLQPNLTHDLHQGVNGFWLVYFHILEEYTGFPHLHGKLLCWKLLLLWRLPLASFGYLGIDLLCQFVPENKPRQESALVYKSNLNLTMNAKAIQTYKAT